MRAGRLWHRSRSDGNTVFATQPCTNGTFQRDPNHIAPHQWALESQRGRDRWERHLYVADTTNNRVLKETIEVFGYTQSTIGTGLSQPAGVAVDASGNIYIADSGNRRLVMETLSGLSYVQSTISSNVGAATSVAVDASGNVYVADPGDGLVYKETPSGSSYVQSTIGSNLSLPDAVAVDGAAMFISPI